MEPFCNPQITVYKSLLYSTRVWAFKKVLFETQEMQNAKEYDFSQQECLKTEQRLGKILLQILDEIISTV